MRPCLLTLSLCLLTIAPAGGQTTTLDAANLALRSSGSASGTQWVLDQSGYVGTYLTLAAPAQVSINVAAQGQPAGGSSPRLSLAVNDTRVGWDVGASLASFGTSLTLPAGTHLFRAELSNGALNGGRTLTIRDLQINGAAISNSNSNANALAAANTYIGNHRRGDATVTLHGAVSGTPVHVKLRNHAFNFGTAVPGSNLAGVNTYLAAHPTPGSTAANFQQRLNAHFNSIVPENAGKWSNNEASRGAVTMANVDRILSYAETNNMRVRMHNLIWGNQQPAWVNSLLSSAAAGNSADAASLRSAISDRINYYIRQRAHRYAEIDIYNESVHTPQYWNVYGASGVAGVYNESAAAIAAAGGSAKAFTNEYNVVQDSADYYANWYRRHVQEIRDAGGSVGGIGLQYYSANATGSFNNQHSPARIFAAMHNLAVEDLPLALTEFGVKSGGSGTTATQQNRAAQILEETMRLVFGMPSTTGFTMWGFWQDAVWSGAPEGVLYNSDWSIRPAGERFTALMNEWSTELTLPVAADGTINFTGFFGDYDITIAGETYALSLKKGQTSYTLFVPEPGSLALLMVWATLLSRRCRSLAR